jgi:type IV pilus assembly protein PilY1
VAGQADNYISVLAGKLVVTAPGVYTFAVNGDDAVDFSIVGVGLFGWYGGHGAQNIGKKPKKQ